MKRKTRRSSSGNCMTAVLSLLLPLSCFFSSTLSYCPPPSPCAAIRRTRSLSFRLFQSKNPQQQQVQNSVNGDEGTTTSFSTGTGGGLIRSMEDTKSQLFAAFTALGEGDQYDAVLTGLCAKILETPDLSSNVAQEALQDPLQLLQEMNQRRIRASPRSLMALIDSTVRAQSASSMAQVLELCKKNAGGIQMYGSLIPNVLALPPNEFSRVALRGGASGSATASPASASKTVYTTRSERLSKITVPSDERESETTAALAVLGTLGACLFVDVAHWDDVATYTNLLLTGLIVVGVVDNFYDLLTGATKLMMGAAASASKNDAPSSLPDVALPDKKDLPFGLGSGQVSGTVVRGLTRLATVDAERESQCEAAALLAAYHLGLPCFAFRPNALEGSVLVIESTPQQQQQKSSLSSSLNTPSGIVRMLVWLLAPVAMENSKYSQMICSDPREADGLLRRLEEYYRKKTDNLQDEDLLPWDGEQDRADLIKWAYAETDLLMRDNKKLAEELSKCLTSGAATIGDCVAIMERW